MNNPASNSGSIAVLALTVPYIPRQTYPISHPVAQVGLSRVNYYADPLSLLVLLGPYQGQAGNETGRLYLNNLPLALSTDVTKDAVTPLEFRLPVGMLSKGVNTLKCTVTRQSGNEDSAELIVLHSLVDPAGNDPDPNPGNSLLSIDANPKSVGPTEAVTGVNVTLDYPDKQLYDTLSIDCGGKVITHQIVPTPQDPNPETKPIVRTLYAADFAHAPNNPQFAFKYNVISQVGDFSGTSSTGVFNPQKFWSKECVIDMHLDRNELEMAILREILSESGDNSSIVDLDKLNGGPLWALIHLIASVWQPGDEIRLTFTAVDGNGTVVATYKVTLPIGPVPGQMSVDIPNVKIITDSKVSVVYEQIRGGKVIGVSKVAEAQVRGVGTGPVGKIQLGKPQRAIAISPDGLRAYVGHDGSISVINITTNQLIHTIITSNTRFFADIFVTPDGAKVYAASTGPHEVLVIDTASNTVLKRIPVQGSLGSVAMSSNGNYLFIHTNSSTDPGAVEVIDTRLNQVIRTFPTKTYTGGAAISPDGKHFYFCEYGEHASTLVMIDSVTGQRIKDVSVMNQRSSVFIDPQGTRFLLPPDNQMNAPLLELDAETLQPRRTLDEVSGPNGYSGTFSPDGSQLYLCAYLSEKCLVLDIPSGKVIEDVETGSYPHGVASVSDGRLYVCNSGSDFLSVIRLSTSTGE